jgi:hypothetical protein
MPGELLARGMKHSRASSAECSKQRARGGRRTADGSGTVRATTSHSTDATRYKVARSEGLEARRCSRYTSRFKPRAAIRDVARDRRSKGSSLSWDAKLNRLTNKATQSVIPMT